MSTSDPNQSPKRSDERPSDEEAPQSFGTAQPFRRFALNVTLVSVLERTPEIGLRRALGAARRHIASQFLLESTVTGLLGGIIGASLGVLVIVAVSAVRDWTPVLEGWLPFAAVGLGAVIGLVAGTYPALRAAQTEPIAALRSA